MASPMSMDNVLARYRSTTSERRTAFAKRRSTRPPAFIPRIAAAREDTPDARCRAGSRHCRGNADQPPADMRGRSVLSHPPARNRPSCRPPTGSCAASRRTSCCPACPPSPRCRTRFATSPGRMPPPTHRRTSRHAASRPHLCQGTQEQAVRTTADSLLAATRFDRRPVCRRSRVVRHSMVPRIPAREVARAQPKSRMRALTVEQQNASSSASRVRADSPLRR